MIDPNTITPSRLASAARLTEQHLERMEALTCALREILNQIQPVRLEPIYKEFVSLQVNGTYRTENEKIARCVDIRDGKFICEIEGKEYAFWETGSPSKTSTIKDFYTHSITAKIIQ